MSKKRSHVALLLLLIFATLQIAFWNESKKTLPELGIVPEVPGNATVQALAFGDNQAYFRMLGLVLQNAGDTFGRFTALYKYDYEKLYHWFVLLDVLDNKSHYIPAMAAYYYSQTQKTSDLRYIVDYLYDHSAAAPADHGKWWWLVQAIYLANQKLQDPELALKISKPMIEAEGVPVWARQMAAYLHEQNGEFEAALTIMEAIRDNAKDLSDEDLRFMRYFVDQRLKELDDRVKNRKWRWDE